MKKIVKITITYDLENGFFIDFVPGENEKYKEDYQEIWIYNEEIGTKLYLYGTVAGEELMARIAESNADRFIEIYKEEFMKVPEEEPAAE